MIPDSLYEDVMKLSNSLQSNKFLTAEQINNF